MNPAVIRSSGIPKPRPSPKPIFVAEDDEAEGEAEAEEDGDAEIGINDDAKVGGGAEVENEAEVDAVAEVRDLSEIVEEVNRIVDGSVTENPAGRGYGVIDEVLVLELGSINAPLAVEDVAAL